MPASSSGSTRIPAPSGTNSGGPPTRVATTVRPHAIASRIAWPNGSMRLGAQTTSGARVYPGTSRCPGPPRVPAAARDANAVAPLETRSLRTVADEREAAALEARERVGEADDVLA